MSENNDSTKSFDALDQNNKKPEPKTSRQKLITSIFVVIILILVSFTVLIFGQIFSQAGNGGSTTTTTTPPDDFDQIYMDSEDVKSGILLLINKDFNYLYPVAREDLIEVYPFKNNSANNGATKITVGGKTYPTYELGSLATSIVLSRETLDAFNKMMLDFCATLDLSSLAEGSNASNINLAWGYSDPDSLTGDLLDSNGFYDHSLATAITLQKNSDPSVKITETILKSDYRWLYDNCYKYGFILRSPDSKEDKTGVYDKERVHLRYIGYEHAYYMKQNGLCLEEYLELLRTQYIHTGEHLSFTADNGTAYEVYYVASSGNPTVITVPKGAPYSVSGDNMFGFIVTITK